MNDGTPVLDLARVNKSFSGVQVLHDVSLTVRPGEVHCIVGENGAGKSTLIKIISGAYQADTGEVTYLGQPVHRGDPRWAIGHGISTIYQEIDVVPALSVAENIFLGNEPRTKSGNVDRRRVHAQARKLLDDIGVNLDLEAPAGSLKVAHHLSIFSKAEDQGLKAFVTKRFRVHQLHTFPLRKIALGSFKGSA